MARFREEDIYEVLNNDWQKGQNIRQNLRAYLGLNNLTLHQKALCLLSFQTYGVSRERFYKKLDSLIEQGLVEFRKVNSGYSPAYEFRKLPSPSS